MSSFTLQTARDEFAADKQDLSDVGNPLFIRWCQRVVDYLYRQLIGVDPEQFVTTQTFSLITSGSQALNSNFLSLKESGTGVFETDSSGNMTDRELMRTGPGSQSRGFYMSGRRIVFTGISTAETFIMRYIPQPPTFSSLNDFFTMDKLTGGTIIIDSHFLTYLLRALDVHYEYWDQNIIAEVAADQRYVRELSEILSNVKVDADVYGLSGISSAF